MTPSSFYRPWRRKDVSLEEQEQIVTAYKTQYISQKEIGRKFRVTE